MCSLSWFRCRDGYEVFFNRDERKTRLRARPPAREVLDGVGFLAPRDGDAGGTWLLTNEFGLTLALLNYAQATQEPALAGAAPAVMSRGKWLWDLAGQRGAEDALKAAAARLPRGCAPFTLALFDLEQQKGPELRRWANGRFETLTGSAPLSSSSYEPEKVIRAREAAYAALPEHDAESLWAWHYKEDLPHSASVRMLRPDAQTWSVSRVSVRRDGVRWLYREELPELALPPVVHQSYLPGVGVAG